MKNYAKLLTVLVMVLLAACTSSSRTDDAGSRDLSPAVCTNAPDGSFDSLRNRDWNLVGLRTDSQSITIDRNRLAEYGFGEVFSLRFGVGRISGVGAPNHYSGPFTLGENQDIMFGMMASTMMAAVREPDELKEHEYYAYLHNVNRWNFADGNLEMYSTRNDGGEVVLVFALTK